MLSTDLDVMLLRLTQLVSAERGTYDSFCLVQLWCAKVLPLYWYWDSERPSSSDYSCCRSGTGRLRNITWRDNRTIILSAHYRRERCGCRHTAHSTIHRSSHLGLLQLACWTLLRSDVRVEWCVVLNLYFPILIIWCFKWHDFALCYVIL